MAFESLRQGNGLHEVANGSGQPPALPPRSTQQHLEPPPLPRGPVHHGGGVGVGGENSHPVVSRKYSPASQNGDVGAPPPLPPPRGTPMPPPTPPRGTTPPPALPQQYNGK